MAEVTEAWVHAQLPFDPDAKEQRMDHDLPQAIYEGDRHIECGCCVAGCDVANIRPQFVAPAGLK